MTEPTIEERVSLLEDQVQQLQTAGIALRDRVQTLETAGAQLVGRVSALEDAGLALRDRVVTLEQLAKRARDLISGLGLDRRREQGRREGQQPVKWVPRPTRWS